MLISKKDLLAITGISYGQLYRWKRERLIPEEWFIKKSSYTGQETFFPREQMLSRIQSIQELKDKYSLEELSRMLSPEVSENTYSISEIEQIEEIDKELFKILQGAFAKEEFSYMEVLVMTILSEINKELDLSHMIVGEIAWGIKEQLSKVKSTGYQFLILSLEGKYYSMIKEASDEIILDTRFEIIKSVSMEQFSNDLKVKYKNIFQNI